ncbi:MAG: hypothetical protein H0V41_06695 [Pseudonocardiales bacterium]|nr:hypothetical protein [Pseudonocardiales bacterium]
MTMMSARGGALAAAPLRFAVTALLLLVAGTACTSSTDPADSPAQPAAQVHAVVPARTTPERTRTPQPMLVPVPPPGTVQIEPGPFTDRIEITDLALQAGDRPAVTGALRSTVDVSELIVLELHADFYDTQGRYLGSGKATYADTEFADNGATPLTHGVGVHGDSFTIAVPSTTPLTGATSAVLTVPQLVNE